MKKNLLSLIVLCFIVCGCFEKTNKAVPLDTIRIGLDSSPGTLDPARMVDVVSGRVGAMLFNGLVRYDTKTLEVIPDIAQSWTLSSDAKTYTFKLSPDVTFSNGRKVTARDFKYSFERVLSPETNSPRVWVLDRIAGARAFMDGKASEISGIRVVSATELVIELETAFEPFLHLLGMPAAYVVPREEVKRAGDLFGSRPVGTGPFVLDSWKLDNEIVLNRRADYFGGVAKTETIVFRIMPEEFSMRTEFEAGNLDIIPAARSLVSAYRNSRLYSPCIQSGTGANTYYIGFNCERKPFDSPKLRFALNKAIERDKIVRAILEGTATPAVSSVPSMFWGQGVHFDSFPYEPEKTAAIVKEIIPDADEREFTFYISANEEALSIAQVIVYYFKRIGVKLKIVQREWGSFKKAVNEGEADLFLMSWWADYPSAENFLYPVFHSSNLGSAGNRARFNDSTFDVLIETARMRSGKNIYTAAQKYIIEKAPWIFLWHKNSFFAVARDIEGFKVYPVYNMDKGLTLYRKNEQAD